MQKCECGNGSDLQCSDIECHPQAQCDIRNGIRGCFCMDGFIGDGLNCTAIPESTTLLETTVTAVTNTPPKSTTPALTSTTPPVSTTTLEPPVTTTTPPEPPVTTTTPPEPPVTTTTPPEPPVTTTTPPDPPVTTTTPQGPPLSTTTPPEPPPITTTPGTTTTEIVTTTQCASPTLAVPTVSQQCIDAAASTVAVRWDEVTASNVAGGTISCTLADGTSVNTTGGTFGVGSHTVTCSVTNSGGCSDSNIFTFNVVALPYLTVPQVNDQCTVPGSANAIVSWNAVSGLNTGGEVVQCMEASMSVPLDGGVAFGLGAHTVNCQVTNSGNCPVMKGFTFNVLASPSINVPEDFVHCTPAGEIYDSYIVTWDRVTATNTDGQPILCLEGNRQVFLNGGSFGVGSHTITCSVANNGGCTAEKSFTVNVVASPYLTVPAVKDQCTTSGLTSATVSWASVSGVNTDGQPIICLEGSTSVHLSGGVAFGAGVHTITCEVTNNASCLASRSFSFNVHTSPSIQVPQVPDQCLSPRTALPPGDMEFHHCHQPR
ncbi:mucin-5AC-like [Acanthaster planci]|uniref:Mucin-5AC-like n=1 Tax=Acanthaster planci TaxID=133434 RepID=A0A8B8A3W8_ACAPL|nr:mucin-5AC-like [Acanthaster planci]